MLCAVPSEERQQLQCLEELDEGELTARADLYDYDSLPGECQVITAGHMSELITPLLQYF
eukprot:5567-Eustigmatos_ZCMA.PRE.1